MRTCECGSHLVFLFLLRAGVVLRKRRKCRSFRCFIKNPANSDRDDDGDDDADHDVDAPGYDDVG